MSAPFLARDAADWTGGALVQGRPEARFAGASIDTRTLAPGQLFAAVVGPHHDAHGFLAQAIAGGASGLLIERGRELPAEVKPDLPVIAVDDTTRALGALATGHRAGFRGPLIAITGSNGKTTTKEMCAAILSVASPCLKSPGNLNNRFGLPLALLRRSESDRSIVVEIAMNHRGEIAPLAAIAHPTVGVITNVGSAHIEHLRTRDEIASEKGDLIAALPPDGVAVLNADDPRVVAQAPRTKARVVRFGRGGGADVRAAHPRPVAGRGFSFELTTPEGSAAVEVAGLGETTVTNALAAAAAALAAGASLDHVATGLAGYQPPRGRLERLELPGDVVVIDDTYNANPQSMQVALATLARLEGPSRRIAVLGDMGELGEAAGPAHRETGKLAATLGIDLLVAVGDHADELAAGAVEAGMDPARIRVGPDCEAAGAQAMQILEDHDRVLVKGSRAMNMERVIEHLAARERR